VRNTPKIEKSRGGLEDTHVNAEKGKGGGRIAQGDYWQNKKGTKKKKKSNKLEGGNTARLDHTRTGQGRGEWGEKQRESNLRQQKKTGDATLSGTATPGSVAREKKRERGKNETTRKTNHKTHDP